MQKYLIAWLLLLLMLFVSFLESPNGPDPPYCRSSAITFRNTVFGRTPLDEWSALCRDLYLTTHNIHARQTSVSHEGFETKIPASEGQQTHAIDRAATGTVLLALASSVIVNFGYKWTSLIVTYFNTSFSFSSLSYDRSKASSKASSPHNAIQSFLFQMKASSPFLKVIQ